MTHSDGDGTKAAGQHQMRERWERDRRLAVRESKGCCYYKAFCWLPSCKFARLTITEEEEKCPCWTGDTDVNPWWLSHQGVFRSTAPLSTKQRFICLIFLVYFWKKHPRGILFVLHKRILWLEFCLYQEVINLQWEVLHTFLLKTRYTQANPGPCLWILNIQCASPCWVHSMGELGRNADS